MRIISAVFVATFVMVAVAAMPAPAQEALPLPRIIAIVAERYHGDVVDVEVRPGKRDEGTDLVYELRLITPSSNVLRIRMDARSGAFLEVDGRGLVGARRILGDAP